MPAPLVRAITAAGKVIDASVSKAGDRKAWLHDHLRQGPVKLEPRAAQLLGEHVGEDLSRVEGLLTALSAAYGEGARISVDDLEPYLGEAGNVPRYELTEAISRGETAVALGVLHRMFDAGGLSAVEVLATMNRHYAQLLLLDGATVSGEARQPSCSARPPLWPRRPSIRRGAWALPASRRPSSCWPTPIST